MHLRRIGIECESIEDQSTSWGVAKIILKLLENLSQKPELKDKYRFVLYFKNHVPDFPFLKSKIFEKKVMPVPFLKNRLFPIYYFLLLPIRLWFERLDWMYWPNYMLPILAFNKSVVMLTEDVYYESRYGKLPFRYRLAHFIFSDWAAKFASKIMAISETSKINLVKLYKIKPERIFVNHLGVEPVKITGRQEYKNNNYLLYVGQAFPRRHLKETLLAFESLAKQDPELKFIAVGPDKYEVPTIYPLANKINEKLQREAVIIKEYIETEELNKLYQNARALLYVSDREAFGLPPMEALSFGVPPIIIDNELGHELFTDYAFYSKDGSIGSIAEAIKTALTNGQKTEKIKKEGPKFVEKYNWAAFTDRFLEIVSK